MSTVHAEEVINFLSLQIAELAKQLAFRTAERDAAQRQLAMLTEKSLDTTLTLLDQSVATLRPRDQRGDGS